MSKTNYETSAYYTHRPVLSKILSMIKGPVLELGCGDGSTHMIHEYAVSNNIRCQTFDSEQTWLDKFKPYCGPLHDMTLSTNWDNTIDSLAESNCKWDLVFIDQGNWEARAASFKKLKKSTKFLILHDFDYFPMNKLLGVEIAPFVNDVDVGLREWGSEVAFSKEFFPKKFAYRTGPPTLLASDFVSCDVQVDWE